MWLALFGVGSIGLTCNMVLRTRRLASEDETPSTEIVTTEPQLVPPATYCHKLGLDTYQAVDYLGTRFRIGDHVAMYTGEGKEWVCVLETLYRDAQTNEAKFRGRWFWSVLDVMNHKMDAGEEMRESKCESHEMICCDNRDTNLVESISRKCHILSYDNFCLVKKVVTKPQSRWAGVYFCERLFYHRANRFTELSPVFFPGDPIPGELRMAAGLPEVPPSQLGASLEDGEGFREPEYSVNLKLKEEDEDPIGEPIAIF